MGVFNFYRATIKPLLQIQRKQLENCYQSDFYCNLKNWRANSSKASSRLYLPVLEDCHLDQTVNHRINVAVGECY